jgi:hypothetical protein
MRKKKEIMIKRYDLHIKGTNLLKHIKERSQHIIPTFYTKIVTLGNDFKEGKTGLPVEVNM